MVNLVTHPYSNNAYFEILLKFKKIFVKGGMKRMKYTIPTLIFAIIRLTQVISYREMHPEETQDH